MFEELVKQAKRLFSAKNNGGKLVPKLTDELHTQKQVLLAFSMVLLLGYSQFRDHFRCQGIEGIDAKQVTDFCLINGTTTVIKENDNNNGQSPTHVGLSFLTNDRDYRVINHNYMRSLWALLILLSLCSYFARKRWASLFRNDVLQAILQLSGSEESRLVRAANQAKPYEMLSLLGSSMDEEVHNKMEEPEIAKMSRSERVAHKIHLVDQHVNIYDHTLDYYPNQLTYLLLTKDPAAYKLSCLKLRRSLIIYSSISTFMTVMQFVLPLCFIGGEYRTFGWRFLTSLWQYLVKLATSSTPVLDNSIDYELSSTIFPILTQCEYKHYAMTGAMERYIVQCTVAINEICGKLFTIIWWFVAINIVIELWSLFSLLICSINFSTVRFAFGLRYWPNARKQADLIASFRYRRAVIQEQRRKFSALNGVGVYATLKKSKRTSTKSGSKTAKVSTNEQQQKQGLSEREKKQLEANQDGQHQQGAGSLSKRWYHSSIHELVGSPVKSVVSFVCCRTRQRGENLQLELEKDINIYYLLYLIYLRLGKSKSKIEQVIKMTGGVLNNYLDDLKAVHENPYEFNDNTADDGKNSNGKDFNNAIEVTQQNVYSQLEKLNQIKEKQQQQQSNIDDSNVIIQNV